MPDFPYLPFPFNVTLASPLFDLSPVASDTNQGWVPSCSLPECVPTASWSTASIGASLSFQYWGWGVAFDGSVRGNMSIELLRDGVKEIWSPLADTLFSLRGQTNDDLDLRNITLMILDSSPDAELTIRQARVNGSSFAFYGDTDSWIIPSNDKRLNYTGFVQQASASSRESQTTYMSSKTGDTVSMQFNASTLLIYGPCGPTNGLIKVTIDERELTINTSTPIPSNDCLLFQSWGLPSRMPHGLLVENVDGGTLGIDRFDLWWFPPTHHNSSNMTAKTVAIVFGSVLVVVLIWVAVAVFSEHSKQGKKIKQMLKSLRS